jgi:phosphatidylserine/phosphatidylglycerophosphate/cardiolipin synthase-like enzyme
MNQKCLSGLLLCLVLLLGPGCTPEPEVWLDPVSSSTPAGYTTPSNSLTVYFTAASSEDYRGGPDQALAASLDNARFQIDCALYDLNLWSIRNALLRAHQRGVLVRVVVEKDSIDRKEIHELIQAGIPVVTDQGDGLMHNKFLVIDGSEVWTGSMNMTVNGAYRHLNNLVQVRSSLIAENFTQEFEEMFLDGFFGENILENTPHPVITIDHVMVETYFSPDDATIERIFSLILEAERSVDFLYYAFTSDVIADTLILLSEQGIVVRGVLDSYQERTGLGSEFEKMRDYGIDVRLDGHPEKMHHKVIIIDQKIVITGSYNLTYSAENINDENTLIIHNEELAKAYLQEFEWIFQEGIQQ